MRRALFAITALLLIAGRAQDAAGQCSISVLDINGIPNLCSDYGDDWRWTGPNGFTASSMCIEAAAPGTYTLRVFDFATNTWSDPCSHTIGDPQTAPGCTIAGPDSVCAGQSVTWCAPTGDFTQVWSGPNGFSSTASCITVSDPGAYTLTVTDMTSGMTSEPCSQSLRLVDCTPAQPILKCPAPARWWASVIGTSETGLDGTRQSAIAGAVDGRSAALDFGATPSGLHELLSVKRHGRAWHAARRHYAAVLANLVADEMDVTDANGRTIGLSPTMLLDQVPGVAPGTTLGQWVSSTEATLLAMNEQKSRERSTREECRRIKMQAREINGGAHMTGCAGLGQSVLSDDDDDEMDGFGTASLTTFGSGSSGGGPFAGTQGVRFTLEQSDDVALDVIDVAGRHVKVLARGSYPAGSYERAWDGRSDTGEMLRPGAYFVAGRIGSARIAQRLILVR